MDGSNHYQLYIQFDGRWEWMCDIRASSHPVAFRKAMLCLKPEHYDKPIRLEQAPPPAEPRPAEPRPAEPRPAEPKPAAKHEKSKGRKK